LPHILSTKQRLVSLDAFRGLTIAAMMLVNNLGSYTQAYPPLLHAEWHGWTPTDLIFPFFLWIVGVAMTFSFARRVEEGGDRGVLIRHTVRRSALIFGLGLLLAGFPYYNLATIRIPGVLQRIALCYLMGSLIFLYTTWRGQAAVIVGLCTAYWMLMTLYPVPGFGPGVLEPIGNFSQYIDWMLLPGHLYRATKVWDPEGVVSTLPAIATLLFGVLVGHLLRSRRELAEKAAWLLATGVLLTVAGYLLGLIMPVNKKIWTVSFAVFTAGLAQLGLGAFYWLVDGVGWKRWATPLVHYGSNAIVVYVLSGLVARLWGLTGWRQPVYERLFVPLGSPEFASLCFGLAHAMGLYLVAWFLYRRGWIIRL
jgi:predicted acyltransferase